MGNQHFQTLMNGFRQFEEVEAILLAGSRATHAADEHSDYDVYVYTTTEIPINKRKDVTDRSCSYMELNNQFWETEDDGILCDGTPIELIYRSLDWLDAELDRVLFKHQAKTGYTTCFWSNLLKSNILYDQTGRAKTLQEKYTIAYPRELQHNIIRKNYPLLKQQLPAYYHQIEKALKRGDAISVHHRLTEFLASYFDILFAINTYPHPGEKRLLAIAQVHCQQLPEQFARNITNVLQLAGQQDPGILAELDAIVAHLDQLLKQEGLYSGIIA